MALETLNGVKKIGGFDVIRKVPEGMSWEEFDEYRKEVPIFITEHLNMISFKIQDGPIKEVGINGCQLDALIDTARIMLQKLNEKFPCEENEKVIAHLEFSLYYLDRRKKDREKRNVEGTSAK